MCPLSKCICPIRAHAKASGIKALSGRPRRARSRVSARLDICLRWTRPRASDREARNMTRLTRSEEHTSELQSLMRISYAVFCLKKKKYKTQIKYNTRSSQIHSNHTTQQKIRV